MRFFVLQYYVNEETSKDHRLNNKLITKGLDIHVWQIVTIHTPRDGIIALMSTKKRYRPSYVRRLLTATSYNIMDKKGLQISGEDGLKIYTRSKRDTYDDQDMFTTYYGLAKNISKEKGIDLHRMLYYRSSPVATVALNPTADDLLAMLPEAAAADGNDGDDDNDMNDDGNNDADESVTVRALDAANAIIDAKDARIVELEQQLQAARATIRTLAAAGASV